MFLQVERYRERHHSKGPSVSLKRCVDKNLQLSYAKDFIVLKRKQQKVA